MSSHSVPTSAWIARKCSRTRLSVSAFIGCAPAPQSTAFPAPGGPETLLAILFHRRAVIHWNSRCEPGAGGFSGPGVGQLSGTTFQLHGAAGQCKYLIRDERDAFLEAAGRAEGQARTFCMKLAYVGSSISEALALTADRVDLTVFESLKNRRSGLYRAVPVPAAILDDRAAARSWRGSGRGRTPARRKNSVDRELSISAVRYPRQAGR